jgi:hypothetical protein
MTTREKRMPSKLDDISYRLGEVSGEVRALHAKLDALIERGETQDRRLRTVENRLHWYSGAGATAGALVGALVAWFTKAHG